MTPPPPIAALPETLDVLVVGAGLSGIAASHYLHTRCPQLSHAIVEARPRIGGTWDLFRYPGVRSDSDMFTLGFSFRPWLNDKAISDGAEIRQYLEDTARELGITPRMHFQHKLLRARWSSATARWTVDLATPAGERQLSCRFLFMCSGYYNYEQGHAPQWPGMASFQGRLVHPQHWPQDLDHRGQRVVVIGSGATAVTLVPAMAATAAHVTLLQRSPSYIVARPAHDRIASHLRRWLPSGWAHRLVRTKNILLGLYFYGFARRRPEAARRLIRAGARMALGKQFDVDKHLAPRYNPWDQRLCLIPDGDLFTALREGRASIVTDQIETFTPGGLRLASGQALPADIIVSATGLQLQMLGGAEIHVDGRRIDLAQTHTYKGLMFSGVPNLALSLGYVNASWTLRCELACRYVCRLLNHLQRHRLDWCVPQHDGRELADLPALNLSSGYVQRAAGVLPKQGEHKPWKVDQNYLKDLLAMRLGRLDDAVMRFERRSA